MKNAVKLICAIIVIAMVFGIAVTCWEPEQCALCSFVKSHAPCIVNMQTGEVQELDLYFPHMTLVGEIAEEQDSSIFSFISAAGAKGTKTTSPYIIDLDVPLIREAVFKRHFCRECRKLLGNQDCGYVLADLYVPGQPNIIPITDGMSVNLRCYEITAVRNEEESIFELTIKGTYGS